MQRRDLGFQTRNRLSDSKGVQIDAGGCGKIKPWPGEKHQVVDRVDGVLVVGIRAGDQFAEEVDGAIVLRERWRGLGAEPAYVN